MSKANQYTRGVLYSKKSEKNYTLSRIKPSEELSALLETYWCVYWDLRGRPAHIQENIPDPCINMVFEENNSRVVGAVSNRYAVELTGRGNIFGIKFRPGGFYALTQSEVSRFSDSSMSISEFFGCESRDLIESINTAESVSLKVELAEAFLSPKIPRSVDSVVRINKIIDRIKCDSTIMKVAHLSESFGVSERTLQRLFKRQVGVSPKWVIRKFRMQEVLSQIEEGNYDWQRLVGQLAYFDQSHFINDFKNVVGMAPTEYLRRISIK